MAVSVSFIDLGCPKNQIDSEVMQSVLKDQGYALTDEIGEAQILVLNTCGFVQSAKEESIDRIAELIGFKGRNRKLIVAGCLAQRYAGALLKGFPQIDGLLGINQLGDIGRACNEILKGKKYFKSFSGPDHSGWIEAKRLRRDLPYAYIKIADGCNNDCSYCAIPKIRGKYRSKPLDSILKEARELVFHGVKEVNLVAQDTTLYGIDLYGKKQLSLLLGELSKIPQLRWIRLLYTHPAHFTHELVNQIASNDKVCKYIDLPLQHISNRILSEMNRKLNAKRILFLIDKLRRRIPNLTLRTSLMVGFPGESKKEFRQLLDFVRETRFEKLGTFAYSREENTKAYHFGSQLSARTKLERVDELMMVQQQICFEENNKKIGKVVEVLIESKENGYFISRSQAEAPEVDNVIYIENKSARIGSFVRARVVKSYAYDLIAQTAGR